MVIKQFATGGKTKRDAKRDGSAILQVLESIGIDTETATNKLNELASANDIDTMNVISAAINTILDNPQDTNKIAEATQTLQSIFTPQTGMFKCGGKMQKLAAKLGKGGDCGCKQEGGYLEADTPVRAAAKAARRTVAVPWPGVARRRMGAVRDNTGGLHLYEFGDINGNTAKTTVTIVPPQDTIVNQLVATEHGYSPRQYPQGTAEYESVMKRFRPFIENGVPYRQDGGLLRAKGYYQNHANEAIIRKLQNFLTGRGYDVGGIDGIFGQKTYNAIRQYQRDNGLKDDGMWGEDTNAIHRVLGAGETTFTGPRSGAHPGRHTYTDNYAGFRQSNGANDWNSLMKQLNDIQARGAVDPDWFLQDNSEASDMREFLFNIKNNGREVGKEMFQDFYNNASDSARATYNRISNPGQYVIDRQTDRTNAAAKDVAKGAGILAGSLLAAEALPLIVENAPALTTEANSLWNPIQARVGTYMQRGANGALKNNLTGRFATRANLRQLAPGTDYAATIANNLRTLTPVGFKCGGKMKDTKSLKCGAKIKKRK